MTRGVLKTSAEPNRKVWADFQARPWRYDFWQALALARRLSPGRVRFKVPARLHFAAGPVAGLKKYPNGDLSLLLNLTGLAGPEAPLPLWLADLAANRARRGDPALVEFLNIFHDRLLNLYQEQLSRLKPECCPEGGGDLHKYFQAAAGVLTCGLRSRSLAIPCSGPQPPETGRLPEQSFAAAALVWGLYPRSASGLEMLVETVFKVKAQVEPLKGAWSPLPVEHRTRLGQNKHQLGVDTISGGHMFDPVAGFTLKLGPLEPEEYQSFLPPPAGTRRGDLLALVKWYVGETMFCQLECLY